MRTALAINREKFTLKLKIQIGNHERFYCDWSRCGGRVAYYIGSNLVNINEYYIIGNLNIDMCFNKRNGEL